MGSKHPPMKASDDLAYVARLVDGLTPANRPTVSAFLESVQARTSIANVRGYAVPLAKLDRWLNGDPLTTVRPERLEAWLNDQARKHSRATVYVDAARLRAFLKWTMDADHLPRPYVKALRRPAPKLVRDVKPIDGDELRRLLEATERGHYAHLRVKWQTILWVLWDSGFRLGELLSLRVSSVEFDDRGGARLRLREGDYGLKTGARTIYVAESVPTLKAWLALHPEPANGDAMLFAGTQRTGAPSMWPENVYLLLKRLCKEAELRHIHPHLFRHTRATRAAKSGWNVPQMCAYFGWSMTSAMPAVYIHLADRDMEELVRRDAGIDDIGRRVARPISDAEFRDRLRRMLMGE